MWGWSVLGLRPGQVQRLAREGFLEVASRKKGQFEAGGGESTDTAGFSVFGGKQFSPVQVEKSSGWKQVAQGPLVSCS